MSHTKDPPATPQPMQQQALHRRQDPSASPHPGANSPSRNDVETATAGMPSANERWLQFSRWLLYHRKELRATQYPYGTPEDIPSAEAWGDDVFLSQEQIAMWDTASTPADALPSFQFEQYEAGEDHDPNAKAQAEAPEESHSELWSLPLSLPVEEDEPPGLPEDDDEKTRPRSLVGRARRRLRRLRDRLRDAKERL